MSYMPQFLTLLGVWIAALISPGPDLAATIHYSIARSRRDGILVALGVSTGIAIWIIVTLVGLGILLAQLGWFADILRVAGALYLAYLGIKTIFSAHRPISTSIDEKSASRRLSSWQVGFLTNISNPKALAFFGSIFSVLLPIHAPFWLQTITTIILVLIAATWFCLVACLFSLEPVTKVYRRIKKWLDYLTGGLFIALGARLAISK